MKKITVIILSVLLVVSLCANAYFCYDEFVKDKTLTRSFEEIVGISRENTVKVTVNNGDHGNDTLEFTDEKRLDWIFDTFNVQEYIFSYTITEMRDGCPHSVTFHDKEGKRYTVLLFESGFRLGNDVYAGMKATSVKNFFENLDWPPYTSEFKYIFVDRSDLAKVVVTDRVLGKQIEITSGEQFTKLYDGFTGSYERTVVIYKNSNKENFTDYRYQIDFYAYIGMDSNTPELHNSVVVNGMAGNRLLEKGNGGWLWTKQGKDIDWSVFTELDWSKAEDIKQ